MNRTQRFCLSNLPTLHRPSTIPLPSLYHPSTVPLPSLYHPSTVPLPSLYRSTVPLPSLYRPSTIPLPPSTVPLPSLYRPLCPRILYHKYIETNYSDEHTLRRYFSKISILTLRTLCLRIFPTLRTLHLEHMIKNPPNVLSVGPVQPNDDTYIYIYKYINIANGGQTYIHTYEYKNVYIYIYLHVY